MTEREIADGSLCCRFDSPSRAAHKVSSRNKDTSGYGRRGRVEAPPTFTTPTRQSPHHPFSSRGSHGKQPRERRREGRRGRMDNHHEVMAQCGGGGEGRKKMSLNHLLNFTLCPRGDRGLTTAMRDGGRKRRCKTHSFNKEQFLQANCQFVVSDRGDYTVHTSDPDLLVDWDNIELVRLYCHEMPSCPICLYPPRAAKMTRCGHVYCWSCILHYLSLGDKKWRKCPICYESIYKKDLKSVMALSADQYTAGDVITMRLMVREKNSMRVLPSNQRSPSPAAGLPSLSDPGERFVKLVTCSAAQSLQLVVEPERAALTSQLAALSSDEASEQCFVELALQELKVRELSLLQSRTAQEEVDELLSRVESSPGSHPPPPPPQEWMSLADSYVEGDSVPAFSDSEGEDEEGEGSGGSTSEESQSPKQTDSGGSVEETRMEPRTATRPDNSSLVYFYQCADGQHLYLHTVNARCLIKEYGGLEHAPNEIKAHIVEMEQLSMTEETRARYKYLSHLPVTCQFALCELDLRPPLLSLDTLSYFRGDLERRRHRRARRRRDEKRREKAALATHKPPTSNDAFPLPTSVHQPLSPERIHDLLPQLTSSPPLPHTSPPLTDTHPDPVAGEFVPGQPSESGHLSTDGVQDGLNDSSTAHPSFAEALRGKPLPPWPIKTPPRQQLTTKAAGGEEGEGGEGKGEGDTVPSFKEAFTEALLTAQVSTHQGCCSKKTAKKGRKKLVLFSTEGTRGSHN